MWKLSLGFLFVFSMQEITFTSLTNCQQQRKVLHYGTLFQVRNCSHAPLCTYVPLQCISTNHMHWAFQSNKWSDLRPTSNYLWLMPYIAHIPYICSKGRCDLLSSWLTSCWCSISWSLVTTQEKQWKSSCLRTTCFQTTNMQPTRSA